MLPAEEPRIPLGHSMSARCQARLACLVVLLLLTPPPTALVAQVPHPNQALPQTRQGLWFSGGLGYGSASASGARRMGGVSGGVAAGWTLSSRVQLGLGATGWMKSGLGESGREITIGIGTLDTRIRFYPDPRFAFFFTGGLGLGVIRSTDEQRGFNHTGIALLGGAGYDIALTPDVSVTPFANYYAVRTGDPRANVGQIGLALTLY